MKLEVLAPEADDLLLASGSPIAQSRVPAAGIAEVSDAGDVFVVARSQRSGLRSPVACIRWPGGALQHRPRLRMLGSATLAIRGEVIQVRSSAIVRATAPRGCALAHPRLAPLTLLPDFAEIDSARSSKGTITVRVWRDEATACAFDTSSGPYWVVVRPWPRDAHAEVVVPHLTKLTVRKDGRPLVGAAVTLLRTTNTRDDAWGPPYPERPVGCTDSDGNVAVPTAVLQGRRIRVIHAEGSADADPSEDRVEARVIDVTPAALTRFGVPHRRAQAVASDAWDFDGISAGPSLRVPSSVANVTWFDTDGGWDTKPADKDGEFERHAPAVWEVTRTGGDAAGTFGMYYSAVDAWFPHDLLAEEAFRRMKLGKAAVPGRPPAIASFRADGQPRMEVWLTPKDAPRPLEFPTVPARRLDIRIVDATGKPCGPGRLLLRPTADSPSDGGDGRRRREHVAWSDDLLFGSDGVIAVFLPETTVLAIVRNSRGDVGWADLSNSRDRAEISCSPPGWVRVAGVGTRCAACWIAPEGTPHWVEWQFTAEAGVIGMAKDGPLFDADDTGNGILVGPLPAGVLRVTRRSDGSARDVRVVPGVTAEIVWKD